MAVRTTTIAPTITATCAAEEPSEDESVLSTGTYPGNSSSRLSGAGMKSGSTGDGASNTSEKGVLWSVDTVTDVEVYETTFSSTTLLFT